MKLYRPDPRTLLLLSALYVALYWATGCADTRSIVSSWWQQQSATEEATESPVPAGPDDSTSLPSENPSGATDAGDAIDPALVTWDEPAGNVGAWKVTAKITAATLTSDGMTATYSGTDAWPVRADGGEKPSVGNWWLIAKCADGTLHAATVEWLGKGKTRVTGKRWDGTDAIHGCVGSEVRPVSGAQAYVMISGAARGAPYTVKERSNIYGPVVWP